MHTLQILKSEGENMLGQVQYYIIPVFICISFLAFIFAGKSTPVRKVSNYFILGTTMIMAVMFLEIVEKLYFENYTYENWQRWFCSIAAYILRPAIIYVMALTPLRDRRNISMKILFSVPLIVNAIFLFISPLCGIVFYFTPENIFVGGPLRFLPFVVGLFYLVSFFIINTVRLRGNKKIVFSISFPVVFMSAAACYLEAVADLRGTLPLVFIVGLLFYYVYFYMDYYTRDVLTGAYQRNRFNQDIKSDGYRYFIIFDINGLKLINDEMGHRHGDRALSSFGEAVCSVLPEKANFYRIGGDEFVILYAKAQESDVENLMVKIKNALDSDDLPYGFSYGYADFDKAEDFNAAYKLADRKMYKYKENFWENYKKDGQTALRRYYRD